MRKLIMTTAAAALLVPAAFAAENPRDHDRPHAAAEMSADAYTQLAASDVSARDLLGEPIHGVSGDRIARVDDIHFDEQGKAQSIVFLSGGFLGIGAKRGALDFDGVSIGVEQEREPRVQVSMTEEAIEAAPDFAADDVNRIQLASNLIGSSMKLAGSDEEVRITDLILSSDGSIRYFIVTDGLASRIAGERRAVKFDKLSMDAAAQGELVLDVTPADLGRLALFDYRRTGAPTRY